MLEFLQEHCVENRVTGRLAPRGMGAGLTTPLGQLYSYWQQNDFPARGIECLDFAQWLRTPQMDNSYMTNFALQGNDLYHTDLWPSERLWQLSNTRFLVTSSVVLPLLNTAADSPEAFRIQMSLQVVPKTGVTNVADAGDLTVVPDDKGPYALIEFTNVLPRAKLYAHWETPPTDDAVLQTLRSRDFNPWQTVLLDSSTPVGRQPTGGNAEAGSVKVTEYRVKDVQLQAHTTARAVLLLNDRWAPEWKASVDGKPALLLRCNYLMRGVFLEPGEHTVEFHFQPGSATLWLSLGGWAAGILTALYLGLTRMIKH